MSLALIPAMQYWFARRTVGRSLMSLWPFLLVAALFFYQKQKMIGTLDWHATDGLGELPLRD